MTNEKVKEMIDSFYLAKRVRELMPPLPKNVSPSYVRYLEAIIKLNKKNGNVKISDVSDMLNLPRPGVTRTINSMVKKGFLEKEFSSIDHRVVYIKVTAEGFELFNVFDTEFFGELTSCLEDISIEDADTTIKTINKFYKVMLEGREKNG